LGVGVTKSSKTVQIVVCCVYKGIPCNNNMNKRKLRFLKLVVVVIALVKKNIQKMLLIENFRAVESIISRVVNFFGAFIIPKTKFHISPVF